MPTKKRGTQTRAAPGGVSVRVSASDDSSRRDAAATTRKARRRTSSSSARGRRGSKAAPPCRRTTCARPSRPKTRSRRRSSWSGRERQTSPGGRRCRRRSSRKPFVRPSAGEGAGRSAPGLAGRSRGVSRPSSLGQPLRYQDSQVAKWVFVTHEHPTERGGDVGDKKDRTSGKIKEKAGTVTGNRGLRQKGRDEQAK